MEIEQRDIENPAKHLLVLVNYENVNLKAKQRKMDENEINGKLTSVPGYLGTYSIDELKDLRIRVFPAYLVINLDERKNSGTHWIAVAIYLNHIYVCDSLGTILPTQKFPIQLIDFLHIVSYKKTLHITKQLQEVSAETCGMYSTYFTYTLSTTHSYETFLSNFSLDYSFNDVIIKLLYASLF